MQRHVWPVAEFATERYAGDIGLEAQAIQTNVFRIIDEVTRTARRGHATGRVAHLIDAQQRVATVVVHRIGAELGVVGFRHIPAQRQAILATVAGIIVLQARDERVVGAGSNGSQTAGVLRDTRWQVETGDHQAVVTALWHAVIAEERATVIDHRLVPLQLVKPFGGDVVGQALGHIEQVDRDQALLHFRTRATQGGDVDRVDAVDRVTDESALAPAHHLLTQAHVADLIANRIVVVDEAVEEHCAGRLGRTVTSRVIDVIERTALVHQLEVVPVLAAHEGAAVAVLELQVMHALEDLREGFTFLEVQAVVVGGPGRGLATGDTLGVEVGNELLVRISCRPARANRQRRIEIALNFPDIENDSVSLIARASGNHHSDGQQTRLEDSAHCFCCHAVSPVKD
ncbi:hypothetical protein D3C76_538810 [compost metagenome]